MHVSTSKISAKQKKKLCKSDFASLTVAKEKEATAKQKEKLCKSDFASQIHLLPVLAFLTKYRLSPFRQKQCGKNASFITRPFLG